MNVGFVGLGKLGLPVAATVAARGLTVYGVDPLVRRTPSGPFQEALLDSCLNLAGDRLSFTSQAAMVADCDVVFLAVQTPHVPRFEGTEPLPADRADFDYTYLCRAVAGAAREAELQQRDITLAVISTVLPGTMARHVAPLLGDRVKLVYNPSFIAMGTVVEDFMDPEFVLLGGDDAGVVEDVYCRIYDAYRQTEGVPEFVRMSIESAELTKVAYNTFVGMKIAYANTIMETCHHTGADVDDVTGAIKLARKRLVSSAYLDGGMGDSGPCHPRDNIALSWLSRELGLSYDLFGAVMDCRERQAEWLVDLMQEWDLPKSILGMEYKPGSHLSTGSSAILCARLLEARGYKVACYRRDAQPTQSAVFLVGCKHQEYEQLRFPEGSVVIDPHRYIPDQEGVHVIRLGEAAGRRRGVHIPERGAEPLRRAAA